MISIIQLLLLSILLLQKCSTCYSSIDVDGAPHIFRQPDHNYDEKYSDIGFDPNHPDISMQIDLVTKCILSVGTTFDNTESFCTHHDVSVEEMEAMTEHYIDYLYGQDYFQELLFLLKLLPTVYRIITKRLRKHLNEDSRGSWPTDRVYEFIGMERLVFLCFLESTMSSGMDWQYVISGAIELDHMLSKKLPLFTSFAWGMARKNNWSNFSLMWREDNSNKSDTPLVSGYWNMAKNSWVFVPLLDPISILNRFAFWKQQKETASIKRNMGADMINSRTASMYMSANRLGKARKIVLEDAITLYSNDDSIDGSTVVHIDTEFSGLHSDITLREFYAKIVSHDGSSSTYKALVCPPDDTVLDQEFTDITGLTADKLKQDGLPLRNVLTGFISKLKSVVDSSNNNRVTIYTWSNIDMEVINESLMQCNMDSLDSYGVDITHVDVKEVFKLPALWKSTDHIQPKAHRDGDKGFTLTNVCVSIGIKPGTHRAESDVDAMSRLISEFQHFKIFANLLAVPIGRELQLNGMNISQLKCIRFASLFEVLGIKCSETGLAHALQKQILVDSIGSDSLFNLLENTMGGADVDSLPVSEDAELQQHHFPNAEKQLASVDDIVNASAKSVSSSSISSSTIVESSRLNVVEKLRAEIGRVNGLLSSLLAVVRTLTSSLKECRAENALLRQQIQDPSIEDHPNKRKKLSPNPNHLTLTIAVDANSPRVAIDISYDHCIVVAIEQESDGLSEEDEDSNLKVGDIILKLNGISLVDVDGGLSAWETLYTTFRESGMTLVVRRIPPD